MIKIEIECATGAEARQQLIDLLYNDAQPSVPVTITDNTEISSTSIGASLKDVVEAAATVTKSKRKADKSEMAPSAALSAAPSDNAPEGGDTQMEEAPKTDIAETLAQDNKEQTAVTAQMLQEKAVAEIRKGKKEDVVAIIKKFGGASISQADKNPLKPEVYADVMDAFNQL